MQKSDTITALAAALSAAQGEIEGAKKDSTNPHFKSKYADLGAVWDACRGPLTKHGLAVVQFPRSENGCVLVETVLTHKSGEWMSETLALPVNMVRLVEQDRRLAPSGLLIAPIGIFWRNHRIDIHADLRIAQHINCISVAFDFCT